MAWQHAASDANVTYATVMRNFYLPVPKPHNRAANAIPCSLLASLSGRDSLTNIAPESYVSPAL